MVNIACASYSSKDNASLTVKPALTAEERMGTSRIIPAVGRRGLDTVGPQRIQPKWSRFGGWWSTGQLGFWYVCELQQKYCSYNRFEINSNEYSPVRVAHTQIDNRYVVLHKRVAKMRSAPSALMCFSVFKKGSRL